MVPALTAAGAQVKVATTNKGMDEADRDFLATNDVAVFESSRPESLNRSPELHHAISGLIREADIVHIHSVHTLISTVTMRQARKMGVPYVLQPHGALDTYHLNQGRLKKQLFSRIIDRTNLRDLSGAIFSSEREALQGKNFLPLTTDFRVTLGVDERLFGLGRTDAPNTEPFVLFLGRVTEKKRLDLLLHAFGSRSIRESDINLVVAGPIDPRLRYDPMKLARDLGIEGRVRFLGKVDADARTRLLAQATVFALPSEDESFGVAAAEAVASGCASLLSANVGIATDLAKVRGAHLVELDHVSVANAIIEMVSNPTETRAMADRGVLFARENYTWATAARQALQTYQAVLARGK
jgi:glycosyltransferase involved in cell wall biosynthesis